MMGVLLYFMFVYRDPDDDGPADVHWIDRMKPHPLMPPPPPLRVGSVPSLNAAKPNPVATSDAKKVVPAADK